MNKPTILAILGVTAVLMAGLYLLTRTSEDTPNTVTADSSKLRVATSFYPLYFFSNRVGGEKVSTQNITPAGAEPHDYEPTAQDMVNIQNSDVLILNGSVEPWATKVLANLEGKNITTLIAGEGLFTQTISDHHEESEQDEEPGHEVNEADPHIWLSPVLAKQEIVRIQETFQQEDQANAGYYAANAHQLLQDMDELDQEFRAGLANCVHREVVTGHDAFGYLASAYGLTQIPIAGISPDEEPSTKQLAEVVKVVRDRNIQYIFFETLVSPKLSETLAQEVGAKTLVLDPLEGISDADMRQGKDYFSVMRQNLANLQIALQCTP